MLEHEQSSNGKIFSPEVKNHSTKDLENKHRKNNYSKTVDISQMKNDYSQRENPKRQ